MKLVWTGYGGFTGWMWRGSVDADELTGDDYWSKVVRVTTRAEGGRVDAVQCYDSAIMTAGPIQLTARFHYLQRLLARCLEHAVDEFIERMRPAMFAGIPGRPISFVMPHAKSPTGYAILVDGEPALTPRQMQHVFLAGSDGKTWTADQKAHARAWVEALAGLLASPTYRLVAMQECQRVVMQFASAGEKIIDAGAPYGSALARESLRACYTAFAINNPAAAKRVLERATSYADPVAAYLSTAQRRLVSVPDTFPKRVDATRRALVAEGLL